MKDSDSDGLTSLSHDGNADESSRMGLCSFRNCLETDTRNKPKSSLFCSALGSASSDACRTTDLRLPAARKKVAALMAMAMAMAMDGPSLPHPRGDAVKKSLMNVKVKTRAVELATELSLVPDFTLWAGCAWIGRRRLPFAHFCTNAFSFFNQIVICSIGH